MDKFFKNIGIGVVVFLAVIVVAFLLALPTMLTWNYVIPYLFGLKVIGPVQAFCLNFLAGTFFRPTIAVSPKDK